MSHAFTLSQHFAAKNLLTTLFLAAFLFVTAAENVFFVAADVCVVTAKHCENFPQFSNNQFRDKYGEELLGAGENPSRCMRRAEDFHHWCGNGRDNENATVATTYMPSLDAQVYHPTACDPGWSLYHKHCYIHVWRSKTWWEAEQYCNKHNSNLCSIHGKAENEFVFTLTKGLSSWIGYNDVDQDEEFQWSDNTKTDFENMSKNCTGREHEKDCQPEEKAQQWYNWDGADRGTWVCKKPTKWALKLLRKTSPEKLLGIDWEGLKIDQPAEKGAGLSNAEAQGLPADFKHTRIEDKDVPKKRKEMEIPDEKQEKEKCLDC